MPVFLLESNNTIFPHPYLADDSGILAIGGDLSPERLLSAYSFGIFPWYNEDDPIIWWSPYSRAVAYPGQIIISKSMHSYLRKYELRIDQSFPEVIHHCRHIPRNGSTESWINDEMQKAYILMYEKGYAHSFETWYNDKLIGGLYGISLGKCFFGESMFSLENNASKFAFIRLSQILKEKEFLLIDCQVPNDHLSRMGCSPISRNQYLDVMRKNLFYQSVKGSWENWAQSI